MTTYANHIRTMLLNQAKGAYGADFPGEEYVPTNFRIRKQSVMLTKIRARLFGAAPDRYMMNYRLYQILQAIHSTEMSEYMTYHDSRITYLPLSQPAWFEDVFNIAISPDNGSLQVLGTLQPNEPAGKLHYWWRVRVLDGTRVRVAQLTPATTDTIVPYSLIAGRSDIIQLPGNTPQFNFAGGAGDQWYIEGVARPVSNMANVVADLERVIGETEELTLFGEMPIEPYLTFRNLWRSHDMYAYRLAGLALALAFRTHAASES